MNDAAWKTIDWTTMEGPMREEITCYRVSGVVAVNLWEGATSTAVQPYGTFWRRRARMGREWSKGHTLRPAWISGWNAKEAAGK